MAADMAIAGAVAMMAATLMTTHSSSTSRTARQTAEHREVPLLTETLLLTRMRRTAATKTTWPCGMPRRWQPAGSRRKEELMALRPALHRRLTTDDSP